MNPNTMEKEFMDLASFSDKVALITGSSRGIGNSIALRFARTGAHIVVNFRKSGGASESEGETLCRKIREMERRALLIRADISEKSSVRDMMEEIRRYYGRLDFLILNAARAPFKPVEKLLDRDLRQLVDTNYLGHIFCIQEALPMLEESGGKIVFVSSLGSRFYTPCYPLGSMKAAMECVVRDCAESLRDRNIGVNSVCGGFVETDSFKVLRQIHQIPRQFIVKPEEIADVVLFLCSPSSNAIRGQTLVVDKGLSNSLCRSL